ncbi:MAG: hypothetical protein QN178_14570 [Armatimonadota bacterium]|nr:hypothetical protein [Armatimonadota bacterium]
MAVVAGRNRSGSVTTRRTPLTNPPVRIAANGSNLTPGNPMTFKRVARRRPSSQGLTTTSNGFAPPAPFDRFVPSRTPVAA